MIVLGLVRHTGKRIEVETPKRNLYELTLLPKMTYYTNTMENYGGYIQTAIVNGLVATIILWGFWTPFILVVVIGLINNQIKDGVCYASKSFGMNYDYSIYNIASTLSYYTKIDYNTILEALESIIPKSATPSQNIINQDPAEIQSINKNMSIIMIISCILVILTSAVAIYFIIQRYNLDGWHILKFNLVMAVIIMAIEGVFFGAVAAQYLPFYPPDMLRNLEAQIIDYAQTTVSQ